MPRRVNRAIELLEQGQPIYYTGVDELSYESGMSHARTWADFLMVEFEHGAFDMTGLDNFMRGLLDGGPTASGHLTPPVVVTLPIDGTNEHVMRANAWMVKQVLARGVHGLLLCHAETPEAVRVLVESSRYPFHTIGVGSGLEVGRRGSGGQGGAAKLWGLTANEYLERADVWPLNPNGEIFLGLKIENRRALENVERSTRVPGIAFAEWGPGDMGMSFGYMDTQYPPFSDEMLRVRARVKWACDAAGVAFLDSVFPNDVIAMIDEGVKIGIGPREAVEIGRKYTQRTMPV